MIEKSPAGTLVVSVDFPAGAEHLVGVSRLLEIFSKHRLPATWAVSNPGRSQLASLVLASPLRHEMAILADSSWIGSRAGRTRLAMELARRTDAATTAGIVVRTLALRETSLLDHWDLLAKHRIRVVRNAVVTQTPSAFVRPRAARVGVWHTSPSARLPDDTRWWPERSGHRAVQAAAAGALVHLLIDGPRCDQRHLRIVDRVLAYAAQCQASHMIHVATLEAAVARLVGQQQALRPLRSILRVAA